MAAPVNRTMAPMTSVDPGPRTDGLALMASRSIFGLNLISDLAVSKDGEEARATYNVSRQRWQDKSIQGVREACLSCPHQQPGFP